MECPKCAGKMTAVKRTVKRRVAGRAFVIDGRVLRCSSCGEELLNGKQIDEEWLAIAAALAAEGPVTGAAFKHMRKAAGLVATELADLLNVTPKTISRWETGEVDIDRGAWSTLAVIVLERAEGRDATLRRLRDLQAGKKPPKEKRLHVGR